MSHIGLSGNTTGCQSQRAGPLMDEGGGKCLHQPAQRPGLQAAGVSMGDATAPVPDGPAGARKAGRSARKLTGIQTVEYALVYQAEKPRLVRFLIQYGANWHEADDAAQRALVALYEQGETVRNPKSWLRTVALREFFRARELRDRARELAHAYELDHGHTQPGVSPDTAGIESLLEQHVVLAAIQQLPGLQRQVFALHFDQFKTSEIAEKLHLNEAAVRQNLARARARLKEQLELTQRDRSTARGDPALGIGEGHLDG